MLPPDILASAMTDRVHRDVGRGRAVTVARALSAGGSINLVPLSLAYLAARTERPLWPGVK